MRGQLLPETSAIPQRRWRFYKSSLGGDPFRDDFLAQLDPRSQQRVRDAMTAVRREGTTHPDVKRIRIGQAVDCWEVRISGGAQEMLRVVFSVEGERSQILLALHGFTKSTPGDSDRELRVAYDRKIEWDRHRAQQLRDRRAIERELPSPRTPAQRRVPVRCRVTRVRPHRLENRIAKLTGARLRRVQGAHRLVARAAAIEARAPDSSHGDSVIPGGLVLPVDQKPDEVPAPATEVPPVKGRAPAENVARPAVVVRAPTSAPNPRRQAAPILSAHASHLREITAEIGRSPAAGIASLRDACRPLEDAPRLWDVDLADEVSALVAMLASLSPDHGVDPASALTTVSHALATGYRAATGKGQRARCMALIDLCAAAYAGLTPPVAGRAAICAFERAALELSHDPRSDIVGAAKRMASEVFARRRPGDSGGADRGTQLQAVDVERVMNATSQLRGVADTARRRVADVRAAAGTALWVVEYAARHARALWWAPAIVVLAPHETAVLRPILRTVGSGRRGLPQPTWSERASIARDLV